MRGTPYQSAGYSSYTPTSPTVIPAMAVSQAPANIAEAVHASSAGGTLNVTYDQRGAWQPTPQMKDDLHAIASTTSAPQVSGGAGLPT
ncbi:hypothetical protein [Mycobacterium gordonae]|uniref:hypothetical protein n=1 Tax=Mycobacterium gordonae TaxID=1778 RepID=UPI000A14F0FD|nr:hypothetical protein [Mycobacterium gordonae]MCV7005711.1 hypothetical protein [Mycobacterium gordonae]